MFQIFKFLLLKMFSCFWDFKTDFVGSKISVIIKKLTRKSKKKRTANEKWRNKLGIFSCI